MKRDLTSLKAIDQARTQDLKALNSLATTNALNLNNVSTVLKSNAQNGKLKNNCRKRNIYLI